MTPKGWLANRGGVCYVKILKMGCKYRCKECGAITLVAGPRPKIDPAVPHTPSCQHYPPLRRTLRVKIEPSTLVKNCGAIWLRRVHADNAEFAAALRRNASVREVEIDVDIDREGRWTFVALRGLKRS
jgi:hypothetical protein